MQFGKYSPLNQNHRFLKKESSNRFRLTMSEFLAKSYAYYCDFSAGTRGYEFSLSHEDIKSLIIGANCFYCGKAPQYSEWIKDLGKIMFNGIDRVDNSIGYVPGNVVACCKQCNTFKSDISVKKFAQISAMYEKIKSFLDKEN